jgi:hypothetical protein
MLEFRATDYSQRNHIAPRSVVPAETAFPVFVFNSAKRENTMPAFTFEKISPPRHHAHSPHAQPNQAQLKPQAASPQKRDNVIQVLGRFVIARVREDDGSSNQLSAK